MTTKEMTWNQVWNSSHLSGTYAERDSRIERGLDKLSTWIRSGLTFREGEKILDAGCGDGSILLTIKRHFNVKAFGVDISPKAKVQALDFMDQENNRFEFQINCVSQTDYAENTFDKIFSLGVIEHFENPLPSLDEKYRILKPGGTLVLMTPNKRSFGRFDRLIKIFFKAWPFGHQDEYTPEELEKMLVASGFKIKRRRVVLREGLPKDSRALKIVSYMDRLISLFQKDWGFYSYVYATK